MVKRLPFCLIKALIKIRKEDTMGKKFDANLFLLKNGKWFHFLVLGILGFTVLLGIVFFKEEKGLQKQKTPVSQASVRQEKKKSSKPVQKTPPQPASSTSQTETSKSKVEKESKTVNVTIIEQAPQTVQESQEKSSNPSEPSMSASQTFTAQYGTCTATSTVSYDEAYKKAKVAFEQAEQDRIERENEANRKEVEKKKAEILKRDPDAIVNVVEESVGQ